MTMQPMILCKSEIWGHAPGRYRYSETERMSRKKIWKASVWPVI